MMARVKTTNTDRVSHAVFASGGQDRAKVIRRPKPTHKKTLVASADLVKEMLSKKEFSGMQRAGELVALYAVLHERVLGVYPEEIRGVEATKAAGLAARCAKEYFDGSLEACARFVCWTWWRQEKRSKNPGATMFRITWRIQFGSSMVSDYKVEVERRKR